MLIKVLPTQIPLVWEHIKYAIVQVNEIPPEHLTEALITVLHDLLSDKAQCWVTLNEDRVILNVSVTRVEYNNLSGEHCFHWLFLYAYQGMTDQTCKALVAAFRQHAKQLGCTRVTGASRNPRACALMEQHGFTPEYRTYFIPVGDENG